MSRYASRCTCPLPQAFGGRLPPDNVSLATVGAAPPVRVSLMLVGAYVQRAACWCRRSRHILVPGALAWRGSGRAVLSIGSPTWRRVAAPLTFGRTTYTCITWLKVTCSSESCWGYRQATGLGFMPPTWGWSPCTCVDIAVCSCRWFDSRGRRLLTTGAQPWCHLGNTLLPRPGVPLTFCTDG